MGSFPHSGESFFPLPVSKKTLPVAFDEDSFQFVREQFQKIQQITLSQKSVALARFLRGLNRAGK